MKNLIMMILVLIFVIGFFILPNIAFAEFNPEEIIKNQDNIELKKSDTKLIFKTLIQELTNEWMELPTAKEQAVLTIFAKEIKIDALQYLLIESSKDLIEVTLKLAGLLLIQDPSIIIGEIEKITVNEAKEHAMDWLLQKEIKVGKGNLKFSYPTYTSSWEQGAFPYIIVYRPLDLKNGEVVIEIYSSRTIKTPDLTAGHQWEGGIDELPPFIVRIEGRVEKFDWVSYRWIKGPEINIVFDEKVPEFEFKEATTWDKFKSFVNELEVISNNVIDLGAGRFLEIVEKAEDVYSTIVSFFSGLNLFGASVAPAPQFFEPAFALDGATAGQEEEEEVEVEEVEEIIREIWAKTDVSSSEIDEVDIDKFQDMLDDITERIDILSQKIKELLAEEAFDGVGGPIEEEPAFASDEATTGEEEEEEVGQKEVGQEMSSLCQKIEGSHPARNKIIFNEVAWMGTLESANDEWIELKNLSNSPISLSDWQIFDKEKQIKIIFGSQDIIPAGGFYLLERTNDDSVPQITADFIYTGGLSNTNEALYLFNENCQLQDKAETFPNWPAGDSSSKRTMERKSNLNWQASFNPGGTPKKENSRGYIIISGGGGGGISSIPDITLEPSSMPKLLISEIQIDSEKGANDEFIELYNQNNEDVSLKWWSIQKATSNGNISKKNFGTEDTIPAKGYFLIVNSHASQNLLSLADMTHNSFSIASGNTIFLVASKEKIISGGEESIKDKVGFGFDRINYKPPFSPETDIAIAPLTGQTLGRKWLETTSEYQDTNNNRDDFEIQTPTPGTENSQSFLAQPILEVSSESLEFSIVESATPSQSQAFTISNSGEGDLEWESIIEYVSLFDANWLKIEPDFGTTPSEVSVSLSQDVSGLGRGNYEAKIVINAEGVEKSPQEVEVLLNVEKQEKKLSEKPSQIIVINEIAWMGTKASSYDEWIELYNPNSEPVELLDWQLIFQPLDSDEPRITVFESILETTTPSIDAFGYFLLERTDDTTVNDIPADYIYTGALNDEGGVLELRDNSSNLIDKVDSSDGWFAGDKDNKISMERINNDWANNNLIIRNGWTVEDEEGQKYRINGTPRSENSIKPLTEISQSLPFDEFDEITLGIQSSPYIVRWALDIPEGKTLNIEPGVVLKFYDHHSRITVNGTLKAIGTEDGKIVFTSLRDDEYGGDTNNDGDASLPVPGIWDQIYFSPTSTNSEMINVIVRYAGGRYIVEASCPREMAGIWVEESSVLFKDSIIEHNKRKGLWLINSSSFVDNVQIIDTSLCKGYREHGGEGLIISGGDPSIKNSLFKNNVVGISINDLAVSLVENNIFEENEKAVLLSNAFPVFINNQAINNNINGILTGGNITQDITWSNNLPYIIDTSINIFQDITLTLDPGVILKFNDKYRKITVDGTLKAIGNENNKIIFTCLRDDSYPGCWGGIYFTETSKDSELNNVIVEYAGGDNWNNRVGVQVEESSVIIKDSLFRYNMYNGVYLINSDSLIENVQFIENATYCAGCHNVFISIGVLISGNSPIIKNSLFKKNGYGIRINSGSPILSDLIFGTGEEANFCNIFQNNECINPIP